MLRISSIVEGHGEVEAVPILLRRIAERVAPGSVVYFPRPIRVKRQQILKVGELERAVGLAARQAGADGGIFVLLDADSDCPKRFAPKLLQRATAARRDRDIRVVLAKMEYEAWFLAAARLDRRTPWHRRIDGAAAGPGVDQGCKRLVEQANATGTALPPDAPPGSPHRDLRS